MPNRAWWAQKVVAFAVDGASNLGVRGAAARQGVDVSAMEHNVVAMLVQWLSLLTPLGEPCHVVQRKLGLALEAAGQVHGDYLAAVGGQRGLYNGARQWRDLERCVQKHSRPDTRSGLRLIPARHRIRWSEGKCPSQQGVLGQCAMGGEAFGFQNAPHHQGGGCVGGLP